MVELVKAASPSAFAFTFPQPLQAAHVDAVKIISAATADGSSRADLLKISQSLAHAAVTLS